MEKEKKLLAVLSAATAVLMLLLLFSHTYNDIVVTTRQGINLWSILKNGDFFRFYQVNILESGNVFYNATQSCAYNFLVYLIFAVWNIPLALLMAFTNVDVMNNVFCLAYAKLLPIGALFVCAWILWKILALLGVSRKGRGILSYVFLSSSLIISVVFITSQYDTLGLIFQLLGLYAYLRGKDKQFVLWFGIAFCFKFFSLVIFLPLLLLRQKRIVPCLGALVGSVVPCAITKLLFAFASGDMSGTLRGESMAVQFVQNMLAYTTNYVNLFVVVYILILVWCYLHTAEGCPGNALWACFVSYAACFGLCNAYPYWSVLLAPFAVLVIAVSPEHFYLNILLETFGYAGLVFSNMLRYTWCYFGNTMRSMAIPKIFHGADFENSLIYGCVTGLSSNYLAVSFLHSVFVAAMTAMAIANYPGRNAGTLQSWDGQTGYCDALVFRACVGAVLCLLPVLSMFI